jgi:hypothetical protein
MVTAAGSRSIHGKATPSPKYRSEVLGKAVLRAAAVLGIEPPHLAKVLGISTSSISRLSRSAYSLKETKKSWELAVLMVRLYQALESIMVGDEIAMHSWMWNHNTALHATPAELIATVQGLVDVVGYVELSRARV